jgi:hypothetical protein
MFNKKSVSVSAAAVLISFFIVGFVVLGTRARADWPEPRGLVGTWRRVKPSKNVTGAIHVAPFDM